MIGLYGHGMHDFVLRELEVGTRAAMFEDSEACGWSALDDVSYRQFALREERVALARAEAEYRRRRQASRTPTLAELLAELWRKEGRR